MIKSKLYERTINGSGTGLVPVKITEPIDLLKVPYAFEFLGFNEKDKYKEKDLEDRIIEHLKEFILEIGKSFSYVGRYLN